MSVILNIDTAIDTADLSIAKDGEIIASASNKGQRDQGAFLQPAIRSMLAYLALSIHELDAVAISAGPGSYTGLRIGMASAKGLCYALKKPLITVGTLEILAFAAIVENVHGNFKGPLLFCPMIDARRMEVFTALFDQHMHPVSAPAALILDEQSFANRLLKNKIFFFGNGAKKWQQICLHENAAFITVSGNSLAMSKLAYYKYIDMDFASLAYAQPTYLKEFFFGKAQQ